MSSFLIVHTTVKDPEKFKSYASAAGATFAPFGGEFLVKGKQVKTLAGEHSAQAAVVVKFPNLTAIDDWYHSADYQALIPNRDAAADMVFICYEDLPA
ncbi:MAG: DUF1330 domain-containing protein [Thiohalomonadales bacterium]